MRQHIAELPPLGTIPGRNNNELKCTLLFSWHRSVASFLWKHDFLRIWNMKNTVFHFKIISLFFSLPSFSSSLCFFFPSSSPFPFFLFLFLLLPFFSFFILFLFLLAIEVNRFNAFCELWQISYALAEHLSCFILKLALVLEKIIAWHARSGTFCDRSIFFCFHSN